MPRDAPNLRDIWAVRAERLLEIALDECHNGLDAIPTVVAALSALRIECGELPESGMEGYPFPNEEEMDGLDCTCPSDLISRGGFRSSCRVHGGR